MRIQLDLSFRVDSVGFVAYPVGDLGRIQSDLRRIQLGLGRTQSDFWGIGGMEKGWVNGGWSGSMEALVRVNGGIEKGQWGHWSGRWSGSMGCIDKGQWVYVRVGGERGY